MTLTFTEVLLLYDSVRINCSGKISAVEVLEEKSEESNNKDNQATRLTSVTQMPRSAEAQETAGSGDTTFEVYTRCLDEIYLRWAGADEYGLPAIAWHCRQLEPSPYQN